MCEIQSENLSSVKALLHNYRYDCKLIEGSARIMADSHLGYLLHTILENAVTHNPNETKRVWVSLDRMNGYYFLEIADNGKGLDDFRKDNLFNKSRRFGGVGLHQARSIMDKYSGTITVEDRVEGTSIEGSKFTLRFPRI